MSGSVCRIRGRGVHWGRLFSHYGPVVTGVLPFHSDALRSGIRSHRIGSSLGGIDPQSDRMDPFPVPAGPGSQMPRPDVSSQRWPAEYALIAESRLPGMMSR